MPTVTKGKLNNKKRNNEANPDGKMKNKRGMNTGRSCAPGITNVGNTCWVNSNMQALAALRHLDVEGTIKYKFKNKNIYNPGIHYMR